MSAAYAQRARENCEAGRCSRGKRQKLAESGRVAQETAGLDRRADQLFRGLSSEGTGFGAVDGAFASSERGFDAAGGTMASSSIS